MRRGHSGFGGWRNENPRHFRPRGSGNPLFRPPRGYGLLDVPRFPPPGPRPPRGPPPYPIHPNVLDKRTADHDRSKYRHDNRQSQQYRQDRNQLPNQRSVFPLLERLRKPTVSDHTHQYQKHSYYEKTQTDPHINSMGDVDHRQQASQPTNSEPFIGHSAWPRTLDHNRQYIDDRHLYRKPLKTQDNLEGNKIPTFDYTGHRPPSSDHYGGNSGSSIDNSNSFSRSVDDTVDIVRRRLQNRNDPQTSEDQLNDHKDEDLRVASTSQNYQNPSEVPPVKKKTHKQQRHRNVESNCDKMKSKIVHELFKMDKGRIHKLMDNPSSSTKFEYAINSLITESQNSLNKHMRSVAEKSLCSSEDFICNDNNTIYEDTFMKQMQYILDPQDTVLLEDIKPLVMEELSKVLQLHEYDQPFQMVDEHNFHVQVQEQPTYDSYNTNQPYDYNDYENTYYDHVNSPATFEDFTPNSDGQIAVNFSPEPEQKPEPLFERRSKQRNTDCSPERHINSAEPPHSRVSFDTNPPNEEFPTFPSERRPSRWSVDSKHNEDKNKESEPQVPLFDTNTQFSEEDDPFAELDKQYHVAVDHTFMESYDLSSPQQTPMHNISKDVTDSSSRDLSSYSQTAVTTSGSLKQEINSQLLDMKSPLKMFPVATKNGTEIRHKPTKSSDSVIKKETLTTHTKEDSVSSPYKIVPIKHEYNTEWSTESEQRERSENVDTLSKSLVSSSSRKRSVDQRPSHRKEKRKKSDPTQSDSNQQILNKNIIINVNDCATKDKEKCTDSSKSIFNLYFSKNENTKEVPKKVDSIDKSYSDKYVKRKEPSKKKEGEVKKRQSSVSSSHSNISPKNSANSTQANKVDCKTKLIDMFTEQPRKVNRQTHKNTEVSPNIPMRITEPSKTKQIHNYNRKPNTRTIGTQMSSRPVNRKFQVKQTQTLESKMTTSRFCQTEKKRTIAKAVQTKPVKFEKSASNATDAFERMKEIDMEIQVLLQEKFKLYNSLESNPSCPNAIQATLGMTVLNVPLTETPVSDDTNSSNSEEDAIVEDFTNIPVEELEQIAMESVEDTNKQSEKRTRRKTEKLLDDDRQSSASPTVKRSNRKAKTLNISLLEQIIVDDRPIEDVIALDDLETTPVKPKKKLSKPSKKKKPKQTKLKKSLSDKLLLEYCIKDCYVLLERKDFSMYLKEKHHNQEPNTDKENELSPEVIEVCEEDDNVIKSELVEDDTEVVEETVVDNDIQFDMMDVSEDIIIGDMCEVKSSNDKEVERTAISEDIILDNSQSSEPAQADNSQSENICKTYDYSTDENLRRDAITVSGNADAVLAIECIENNFVAACLDGSVYYYSNDGQLISTLRGSNFAVTCLAIVKVKGETTVYTGSLDSRIRYYDLETGLEKGPECNVLSPIQTMDRAWDTIFVGTRTGFVLQFECKNNMLIPVSTVKFSDQSILALRAMKEGPRKVLLVAARSENVTIKDAQTGLLLRTLEGPKMTVYTLLYEDGKVFCGTSSNQIHVFDYTSGSHVGVHEGGKGAVCLRATGGLLFAGCYDGCVYVYREGEPRPLAQLRGPGLMLLSLAVLGSKIIAGYKDRSLYIWKIPVSILQEMIL